MSTGYTLIRRRALSSLDPNWMPSAAYPWRRRVAITCDQENEGAVLAGIAQGVYDAFEVIASTNQGMGGLPALDTTQGSDEETLAADDPAAMDQILQDDSSDSDHSIADYDTLRADEMMGEEIEGGLETGIDDEDEDEDEEDEENDEEVADEQAEEAPFFDPAAMGLKEINNLAHFGVSSHKPGNGVEELLSDDLDQYWQSDGQQPHLLTIHFLRRVEIRAIRFYVDYNQDESYTPTHIIFHAGTGHHDLIQFAELPLTNPVGWQDVPLADCGGGPDGQSLCCWLVQVHIKENHQNGKDTHIRGIKIFALDEYAVKDGVGNSVREMETNIDEAGDRLTEQRLGGDEDEEEEGEDRIRGLLETLDRAENATRFKPGEGGFSNIPDFMRDPEIR